VRGRLAVKQEQADGWWENRAPGGKDTMETDALGVRGHLEFDVTDKLLARLSISYSEQPRHLVGTYKSRNFYFDDNGVPTPQPADLDAWGTGPGNNLFGYRDPYADGQTSAFENRGFLKSDSSSPTLMLQWTLGSTTLTSVTNYTDFSSDYAEEIDGSPIDFAAATARQSVRQWSQEIRGAGSIGSHEWTAGVYYLDIETSTFGDFFFPILSGTDFAFDNYQTMNQQTNSLAPFGQVEWQLGDRLTLITGIRYTYDEKTFDSQVYFRELGNGYSGGTGTSVFPPPGLLVYDFRKATVGKLAEQNEGLWSGKVQLDYKPEAGGLLYAGISRGVKGAGFNGNLGGGLSNEDTPFDSESVTTYELGGKFDVMDNRLRLNSSVYYYDYSDYQGYAFNGTQGVVGNYDGRFFGAELEMQANLPGDVLASIAASYSDTQLSDVPTAYFGVRDVEAVLAPEWIVNGFVRKDFQIGSGSLAALWSFDYVSERYASVDNNPATFIDDSVAHNLRLTYTLDDSGLELAAFVNNVADTDRQTFVYDVVGVGGFTGNLYDRPRTWGLSVRKSF
jgi:iron complex outermembrane receptor protein